MGRMMTRMFGLTLFAVMALANASHAQFVGRWTVVDSAHGGATSPYLVASTGRGHYVVVTHEGFDPGVHAIRRTTDAGATWRVVRADSGRYWRVTAIANPTANLIIVAGDTASHYVDQQNSTLIPHPFILRSSDGGATWSRRDVADGMDMESIAMADASSGIVVASRSIERGVYEHSILTTTDGGMNWSQRQVPNAREWMRMPAARAPGSYVVVAFDPAVGVTDLLRTSDDGMTWRRSAFDIDIRSIDFFDGNLGIAVGGRRSVFDDTERDIIQRTTDGGATWATVIDTARKNPYGLWDVEFADADNALAVGGFGKIMRTNDAGSTWRQEWPPAFVADEYAGLNAIAYPVPDEAMATTRISSYVLRCSGVRIAPPQFIRPNTTINELPFDAEVEWTPIEGAVWYDLQVADTSYDYRDVNHRMWDVPWIDARDLTSTNYTARLDAHTTYSFRVRARSESDTSDWSGRLVARTRATAQSLYAPTFTAPLRGREDVPVPVRFDWTSVTGATGYDLTVFAPFGDIVVDERDLADTTYVANNLELSTLYYARVRASHATATSEWSSFNDGMLGFRTSATASVRMDEQPVDSRVVVAPNPVLRGTSAATIDLMRGSRVRVRIADMRGGQLAVVCDRYLPAGRSIIPLELNALPSGTLLVVVSIDDRHVVKPLCNVR